MHNDSPTRRTASVVFLLLAAVGALVVLGWAFKAALFTLGILARFLFGFGGLVVLGLLIFVMARNIAKK